MRWGADMVALQKADEDVAKARDANAKLAAENEGLQVHLAETTPSRLPPSSRLPPPLPLPSPPATTASTVSTATSSSTVATTTTATCIRVASPSWRRSCRRPKER